MWRRKHVRTPLHALAPLYSQAREEQVRETKQFRGLDRVLKSSAKPANDKDGPLREETRSHDASDSR